MPPRMVACPNCGTTVAAETRFCPNCEVSLLAARLATSQQPAQRRGWRRRLGIGAGALVGLCVALAALGAVVDSPVDPTPTPRLAAAGIAAATTPSPTRTPATTARSEQGQPTAAGSVSTQSSAPTSTSVPPTPTPRPSVAATATRIPPTPMPRPTETPQPTPTPKPTLPEGIPTGSVKANVVDVVDGDTVRFTLADGSGVETVRLIGIDTPETKDPNDPVECFGAEATDRTEVMLRPGRTVYLERDVTDRDRYDRLLRYVWFLGKDDGKARLANEILVREGLPLSPPTNRTAATLTASSRRSRKLRLKDWDCGARVAVLIRPWSRRRPRSRRSRLPPCRGAGLRRTAGRPARRRWLQFPGRRR